jgi:hypothetical protein
VAQQGDRVVLSGGVKAGERIVVKGGVLLSDFNRSRIRLTEISNVISLHFTARNDAANGPE